MNLLTEQVKSQAKDFLKTWVSVRTTDPAKMRRGRLLSAFILSVIALTVLLTLLNLGIWAPDIRSERIFYLVTDGVALLSFITIWIWNRAGHTRSASVIFLSLVTLSPWLFFIPVAWDDAYILIIVPVLMSSFVLSPVSSFGFALLSIVVYTIAHITNGLRPFYNYIAMFSIIVTAFTSWLIATYLEHTLTALQDSQEALRQDIKQRRKIEAALETTVAQRTAELQVALAKAQAADLAKSQFVSNVSHELRTPLTSIRLYLRLLQSGPEEKAETYIAALERETMRLQYLIEDILLISRLDLGRVPLNPRTVDLNGLIHTLVDDRQQLFIERDLTLQFQPVPELPPLQADAKLIERVLTNLLTNAMHYTLPGGEVIVETAQLQNEGQSWVTVAVEDTGIGIEPEEQTKLFQRFQRGKASTDLQIPGTGLGLAICKEIVNLHHGRITLESAPDQGSTFTVWLPVESMDGKREA